MRQEKITLRSVGRDASEHFGGECLPAGLIEFWRFHHKIFNNPAVTGVTSVPKSACKADPKQAIKAQRGVEV
jgi:hypothetical protein